MYLKIIRVSTTLERKAGFLQRQDLWNKAMADRPGFVTCWVAENRDRKCEFLIITAWRDQQSLEGFMEKDHDRIEADTGIRAFYDQITVDYWQVEEEISPFPFRH